MATTFFMIFEKYGRLEIYREWNTTETTSYLKRRLLCGKYILWTYQWKVILRE